MNIQADNSWPIRKALVTPVLVLGTERALLILNLTLCACFFLSTHVSWPAFFTPLLFVLIHAGCVMASKHDPRAVAVFKRSTRYRGFYPAKGGVLRKVPRRFSAFPEGIKN